MSDWKDQFEVVENDDAERYEFHSKTNDSCSYTVHYSECAGYLDRAWEAVEKSRALEQERRGSK